MGLKIERKKPSNIKAFYEQMRNIEDSNIPLNLTDPLEEMKKNCKLYSSGEYNCKIAFIGFQPSQYEIELKKYFCDKPHSKLHQMIEYLNRHINLYNNVYYTNIYLGEIGGDIDEAHDRLVKEMQIVNPKYIVALGVDTLEALLNEKKESRLKKYTIMLDKFYTLFYTHSPKELFYDRDKYAEDVKKELDFIIENV